MADLGKGLGRRRADLARGAVRSRQPGKARLDFLQAALQRVVVGIGDIGRVLAVIGAVGLRDRPGQAPPFRSRRPFAKIRDGHLPLRILCPCPLGRHDALIRIAPARVLGR